MLCPHCKVAALHVGRSRDIYYAVCELCGFEDSEPLHMDERYRAAKPLAQSVAARSETNNGVAEGRAALTPSTPPSPPTH